MSFFNNIYYRIIKASGDNFNHTLDEVLHRIDNRLKILRLVFFSNVEDDKDYLNKLHILHTRINEYMNGELPAISLVSQRPLDADIVLEVHYYQPDENECLFYKTYDGFSYVVLTNNYGKFLYAGGLHASLDDDVYIQSRNVFNILDYIMQKEGFPIESIVRQWNYIGNITSYDSFGNQHYQMFNNARSEFYNSSSWTNGFPAATGIGTKGNYVVVDVDAVVDENLEFKIKPIDNKLQIAAHAYSTKFLEKAKTGLTTPKFERAKSLNLNDERLIYVSGTAAIRGENSVTADVLEQLYVTMENIRQLISGSKIRLLRVYLKKTEDYEQVQKVLSGYTDVELSYFLADVCRNELLIEIEGIA